MLHPEELRAAQLSDAGATEAAAAWRACLRAADRRGDGDGMARASYFLYWAESDGASTTRLQRATRMGDTSPWAARARALIHVLAGEFDDAIACDRRALELLDDDPLAEAICADKLAIALAVHGELDAANELMDRSRLAYAQLELPGFAITAMLTFADMLADGARPSEQLAMCEGAVAALRVDSPTHLRIAAEAMLANAQLATGDVRDAVRSSIASCAHIDTDAAATPFDSAALIVRARLASQLHAPNRAQLLATAAARADELGFRSFQEEVLLDVARERGEHGGDALASVTEPLIALRGVVYGARRALAEARYDEVARLGRAGDSIDCDLAHARLLRAELELAQRVAASDAVSAEQLDAPRAAWQAAGYPLEAALHGAATSVARARRSTTSERAAAAVARTCVQALVDHGMAHAAATSLHLLRDAGVDVRVQSPEFDGCRLTLREIEVLFLVADGLSNTDIVRSLGLTASTVEKSLGSAYRALEIKHRAAVSEAVARVICFDAAA